MRDRDTVTDVADDGPANQSPPSTQGRSSVGAAIVFERLAIGRWRVPVVFSLVALVYLVTTAPAMVNDTRAAAAAAWNLANFGTLDFHAAGFESTWHPAESPTGALLTDRFPGTFLVAVPFYWLLGSSTAGVDVVEAVPHAPAGVAAAVMVAIAIVALVEVLRTVVTPGQALGSGLVVAFATPMWSVAGRALWTHSVGATVLGLAVLAITRQRWWWAGAAMGWAMFVRPTHAIMAAVLGLGLAWARRSWRPLLGIGIPSVVGLGALSWYSHAYFGTWLPVAGYKVERVDAMVGASPALLGEFTWTEQLVGTFVHPYHGLLPYSVFLVPLAFGVVAGWREAPDWARISVVAGAAYWLLQLRGNRFTGGFNFVGYRFPLEPLWLMVPVFVSGYAERARRSRLFRRVTMGFVAVSVGWMVALVVMSPNGYLDEPRTDLPAGQTGTATTDDTSTR